MTVDMEIIDPMSKLFFNKEMPYVINAFQRKRCHFTMCDFENSLATMTVAIVVSWSREKPLRPARYFMRTRMRSTPDAVSFDI